MTFRPWRRSFAFPSWKLCTPGNQYCCLFMQLGARTVPTLNTPTTALHMDMTLLFLVTLMFLSPCAAGIRRCDGMWNVDVGPKPFRMNQIFPLLTGGKWKRESARKGSKVHPSLRATLTESSPRSACLVAVFETTCMRVLMSTPRGFVHHIASSFALFCPHIPVA